MKAFAAWVIDNKEWVFSGAGLAVIAWVGRLIFKKTYESSSSTQTIRSGNNSTNIQAGRDVNIAPRGKGNDAD